LFEFGDIPPVVINAFHLEQAVLNVINNAIDAMGEGGQLKIGTSVEERDGKIYVVVSIADTGQGMANKRIGELSEDRGNNGKGFGLFITHEILKHYNGHLELDSKMNYGTTIKLFIPSRIAT
jgi:two-component system, NtrC family, nitrogen regulation sensor histidine kinase GlnL